MKLFKQENMKNLDLIMLWVRAGGACSICKKNLLIKLPITGNISLADRAHIIPHRAKGPRGDGVSRGSNSYENRILVCPSCHRKIDRAILDYPEEKLLKIKEEHERFVENSVFGSEARESLSKLLERSGDEATRRIITKLSIENERHTSYSSLVPRAIRKLLGDSYGYYSIGIRFENIGSTVVERVSTRIFPVWKTFPDDFDFSVDKHITRDTDTSSNKLEVFVGPMNVGEAVYLPTQFYLNYRSNRKLDPSAVLFEYYITCDESTPGFGEIEITR
ncbi:HNH endonuclease [Granulosicoccus sp.]|nr:HNH endonuclease [Granulosicoccus sp.]